jgi:hypothetical protein
MFVDYSKSHAESKWNWFKNFGWTQTYFDWQCDDYLQVENLRNNLPYWIT